ncbi:MAG TPA: TIGR03089 family protein [Jatrophihabitantaceae bacterium]
MTGSPEALFAAVLDNAPSKPFVTFYDEGTGERSELSAKSLANWVAKTHFLLTDELGLGVGDAAYVDVPAHWISVPILLGCWTAGLEVVGDPERGAVAFVASTPEGRAEYVAAVRPQADVWATVHAPAAPSDPAVDGLTRADLVAKAAARAGELGMAPGARILTARDWHGLDDWVDTLLAALSVGGSLVIVHGGDAGVIARRAEQERATNVV